MVVTNMKCAYHVHHMKSITMGYNKGKKTQSSSWWWYAGTRCGGTRWTNFQHHGWEGCAIVSHTEVRMVQGQKDFDLDIDNNPTPRILQFQCYVSWYLLLGELGEFPCHTHPHKLTWHDTKMAPMSPGLKELCDAYSLARREYYFDRLLLSYSSMVSSIIVHVFILICIVFYISVFLWSPHSCIAFIWLDCLGRQLHLLYLLHLLDWIVEVSNCIYLIGLLRSPRNFDSILGLYRTGKLHLSQGVRNSHPFCSAYTNIEKASYIFFVIVKFSF